MENIENCTKAKSVFNVLGPIANQIVELKGKHGTVCDATAVMKLMKQCQMLQTACNLLVARLSSYANCHKDALLTEEVQSVRKKLDTTVELLTDFTRDLHRGDVGVRDNEEVWSDIVENTEQLLSLLTDALLAWDRAQVRRISKAIAHIQECLARLHQTRYIQHLPEDFQELVSACGELMNLVEARCGDLYRRSQSETLLLTSLQLCHTLHLLAETCAATVSHPLSKHVKASRELVLNRLQMILKDLESHAGQGKEEYELEDAGTFVSCVDQTLELLSSTDRSNEEAPQHSGCLSERVKLFLEDVLRHGVAVAYCSSQDDNQAIMSMCENVLKHLKNLVNLERLESCDAIDFQVACDTLADSIEVLEQKVNTSLIRQIVKTFAAPFAALEMLMKTLEPSQNDLESKDSDALIADFDQHVDHIFQVGGFAAACTSDLSRVRLIRDSLLTLEWLESCLIPSVLSARNDCHLHAKAHAHMLAKQWRLAVTHLNNTLDQIMDASAFSLVTKQEVHHIWAILKEKLYCQDTAWISRQVKQVIALASRVLALHQLDNFLTDPQEEDLQLAITEIRNSMSSVIKCPTDLSRHRSMVKRVQLLLTLLSRLANSLNEENLPYLDEFSCSEPKMSTSKGGIAKLTGEEKHHLLTSNISDIPVDVATPMVAPQLQRISRDQTSQEEDKALRPQQNKLTRSLRSASKLGEGRCKPTSSNLSSQGHHSRSLQAITSDTLCADTCVDISKFLSRSVNTLHSSTRSSKRNFSLKVKEISLDIDGAIKNGNLPPLPCHSDAKQNESKNPDWKSEKLVEASDTKSLCEVSELIAKEDSPLTSQCSIENELTDILENLTSLAGDLTSLANTSTSKKRKCQWENFDEEDEKENHSSLRGIKIQNVSFNPHFPEIQDKNTSEIFNKEKHDTPFKGIEDKNDIAASSDNGVQGFMDPHVWKDFTAILESKTPGKSSILNFTSNFRGGQAPCTPFSFSSFGKNSSVNANPAEDKVADLSDTPFITKSSSQISLSKSGDASDRFVSNYSVSPSSAGFGTPQRLKDIQLVQQRLKSLKESIK